MVVLQVIVLHGSWHECIGHCVLARKAVSDSAEKL
jgi:hypothetical protein